MWARFWCPSCSRPGYRVTVLDLFIYGDTLAGAADHPGLQAGARRSCGTLATVERCAQAGCDSVIHLACISNDPSFELDPGPRQVDQPPMPSGRFVRAAKAAGVERFIYASSSSVYGIKEDERGDRGPRAGTADRLLEASRRSAKEELLAERAPGFAVLVLRPATVCGYSPRLRLDLTVNILTNHADQRRPHPRVRRQLRSAPTSTSPT